MLTAQEDSLTRHKIGIAHSPSIPALILFYTRGASGLRKRVMPVRGLEDGSVEAAVRRLVAAQQPYLDPSAVSEEQLLSLCNRLHRRANAAPKPVAAPKSIAAPVAAPKPASTPRQLDRSFLQDLAGELSPDLDSPVDGADSDAEDAALAAFARGQLAARAFSPGGEASSGHELGRRQPATMTDAAANVAAKPKGKASQGEDGGMGKGGGGAATKKAAKAKKGAKANKTDASKGTGAGRPSFAGLEALLGMSSEDEAEPALPPPRSSAAGGMSSLRGMPSLGPVRSGSSNMSSLAGMPALF